jgi:hypothetical protein
VVDNPITLCYKCCINKANKRENKMSNTSYIVNNKLAKINAMHESKPSYDVMTKAIQQYDASLVRLVKTVANGGDTASHLVLMGDAGMGKTHTVEATLEATGTPYVIKKGTMSGIGLYRYLYDAQELGAEVVVIDDCDDIYRKPESVEILKAAMDSKSTRRVSWTKQNTNLEYHGVPTSFEFTARVILITNSDLETPENKRGDVMQRLMAPVLDRSYTLKTGLPSLDWVSAYFRMMHENNSIVAFDELGLDDLESDTVMEFILGEIDFIGKMSFRVVYNTAKLYLTNPDDWQEMAQDSVFN